MALDVVCADSCVKITRDERIPIPQGSSSFSLEKGNIIFHSNSDKRKIPDGAVCISFPEYVKFKDKQVYGIIRFSYSTTQLNDSESRR